MGKIGLSLPTTKSNKGGIILALHYIYIIVA